MANPSYAFTVRHFHQTFTRQTKPCLALPAKPALVCAGGRCRCLMRGWAHPRSLLCRGLHLRPPSHPQVIHSPPPPSPGLGVTQQGEPCCVLHPNLLCISTPFASLSFSCTRKMLATQGSQLLQDGNITTNIYMRVFIYLWYTHSLQENCCLLKCPVWGWHVPLRFPHTATGPGHDVLSGHPILQAAQLHTRLHSAAVPK